MSRTNRLAESDIKGRLAYADAELDFAFFVWSMSAGRLMDTYTNVMLKTRPRSEGDHLIINAHSTLTMKPVSL